MAHPAKEVLVTQRTAMWEVNISSLGPADPKILTERGDEPGVSGRHDRTDEPSQGIVTRK
jgi:hypothetical protein